MKNETHTISQLFSVSTAQANHHVYIHSDGIATVNGLEIKVKKGDTIQINYQVENN